MTEALLRLRGVQKRYGGVRALRGVDLDVLAGEVHAIVGENGAGKSTLIKIVSGAEVADEGTVEIDGAPLHGGNTAGGHGGGDRHRLPGAAPVRRADRGRERVPRPGAAGGGRVDWATQRTRVSELLEQIGLDPAIGDVRVADLPVAEQQLVSIAKAFAHSAKILILDEPSAILTDREIEVLFGVVRNLRAAGVGIIYISHRLDELSQISDRVTVLRDGEVVASRPTSELTVRQVAELMVGHELGSATADRPPPTGDPVLTVAGLGRTGAFTGLDLQVRPAEVVALYGLIGSGTAAIARALYGVNPADAGTVQVDGRAVRLHSPQDAAAAGIAMLPGNRKQQGVFANKSIAFNISSAHLRHLAKLGFWFDRRRERSIAQDFLQRIAIKAPDVGTAVGALSGGNQQKVVLARQLVRAPRVLVLEEPTQGVDVGAKEEIHRLVLELADGGSAVLVISTDLPEVLQLADRVLVVRKGAVVREFGRGASQADVLAAAAGDEGEAAA